MRSPKLHFQKRHLLTGSHLRSKQFTTAILEVVEPQITNDAYKEPPKLASRTPSGGIDTTQGTIYVSKPIRTGKSRKLRAMVSFSPRKSAFDITNEQSFTNEFRVRRYRDRAAL